MSGIFSALLRKNKEATTSKFLDACLQKRKGEHNTEVNSIYRAIIQKRGNDERYYPVVDKPQYVDHTIVVGDTVGGQLTGVDSRGKAIQKWVVYKTPKRGVFTIDEVTGEWTFTCKRASQSIYVVILCVGSDGRGARVPLVFNVYSQLPHVTPKTVSCMRNRAVLVTPEVVIRHTDTARIQIVSPPEHGRVRITKTGSIVYLHTKTSSPNADSFGCELMCESGSSVKFSIPIVIV